VPVIGQEVKVTAPADRLVLDGSYGEGGGQIVRTCLTLAAILGRAFRIERIRAGRAKPGLAAQHVTAVRATAALCEAAVTGDQVGSTALEFAPQAAVSCCNYAFDVATARQGGSAGAASLVIQTVLLPLALASGRSRLSVHGGTHMAWSPTFDYLSDVWLPTLTRIGLNAQLELRRSGWFPFGQGEIVAAVTGIGPGWRGRLRPLTLSERGALLRISGRALAANLPAHIAQRMAERSQTLLHPLGVPLQIAPQVVEAACAGCGLFLTAEYEKIRCGFSTLGVRGKPAEEVAEEAVAALLAHQRSDAALDVHLADQIIVPLALAGGRSQFSVERISRHLTTNTWVIERFGLARIHLELMASGTGFVTIEPQSHHP
jgi:RNA 3'-terminal phosphate cyclase (ATP)